MGSERLNSVPCLTRIRSGSKPLPFSLCLADTHPWTERALDGSTFPGQIFKSSFFESNVLSDHHKWSTLFFMPAGPMFRYRSVFVLLNERARVGPKRVSGELGLVVKSHGPGPFVLSPAEAATPTTAPCSSLDENNAAHRFQSAFYFGQKY